MRFCICQGIFGQWGGSGQRAHRACKSHAPQLSAWDNWHSFGSFPMADSSKIPSASPPEPPNILGFQTLGLIGEGAYGRVWLVEETLTGVRRALKVLPKAGYLPNYCPSRELAGIREYQLKSKGHPALIQILHAAEHEDLYYYIMELADNAEPQNDSAAKVAATPAFKPLTLSRVVEDSAPLPADRALELIATILEGLAHLHVSGLIHRDVKPSNVLFIDGKPKLADMGLVTTADRDVTMIGTPGYMPPDATIDQTTDLYATGVILYELITGLHRSRFPELPVLKPKGRKQRQLLRNAIHISNKAAQFDRRKRYGSAQQFLRDVNAGRLHASKRRRLARAAVLAGLIIGAWGAFTLSRPAPSRLVAIDPPAGDNPVLTLRYASGEVMSLRLPAIVAAATMVNFPGRPPLVAVGTRHDGPQHGRLLILDPRRPKEMLQHPVRDLTLYKTPPWAHQPFGRPCCVQSVVAADLDGIPGDELIACEQHEDGPVRWVVFDANLAPLSEYWHYGHLSNISVGDVCGDPRPELVLWGMANRRPPEPRHRAIYEDYFPAAMILDPNETHTGRWSVNDWMNDPDHPPIAYGHIATSVDDIGRVRLPLYGFESVEINRNVEFPIRARTGEGLLLDFDAHLRLADIRLAGVETAWKAPVPRPNEFWITTWPHPEKSVTELVHAGE